MRIEECTKCAFKGIIGDSISVVSDNNLCTSCQLIGNTINCNSGCIGLKAVPYIFAQGILVVLRNTRTLYTLIVYTKLKNHLNTPNCLYLSPRLYFSSALKLAVEQRLIARNPADGCALPKAERKEMQTLPVEQLTSFLREAKDSGVFALYYIDLTTGLRRGELLGLKWSDIDLEKGDLRVQRQIGRIDGKIIEMPLKTKNAYRTLPLSADAIDVLKAQKNKVGSSEWVFPSPTGGPMSPDSVLHMLHRVLKRAGLPKVRFHDLRHTFATLALQNGVDIKTVSGMLGHFSAGFTLDTYAHVTTSAKREAAKTMGNILSGAV